MKDQYITLVYNSSPKNGHFEQYPELEGRKVTAVYWGHATEELDAARYLLGHIQDFGFDNGVGMEKIDEFFNKYP